jgi:hypothetical protein
MTGIVNGDFETGDLTGWEAWDDVEVLTGKKMQPTPGKKKTILLGQCMYNLHKDNQDKETLRRQNSVG